MKPNRTVGFLAFVSAAFLLAGCVSQDEVATPKVAVPFDGPAYISPASSPGTQDSFRAEVSASSGEEAVLLEFTVIVRDAAGEEVYRTSSSTADTGGAFEDPRPVEVPAAIRWDGRNAGGSFVSEGEYSVIVRVKDNLDQANESDPVTVVVDNTPPKVTLDLAYNVFSPDGDGNRDALRLHPSGSGVDTWTARVLDQQGSTVRSWTWESTIPETVTWNGTGSDGNTVPDGTYRYVLRGIDSAGNTAEAEQSNIVVNTNDYSASVNPAVPAFSPNGDGVRDELQFDVDLENPEDVVEWRFTVVNSAGDAVLERTGQANPPQSFIFEGRSDGDPLPEGQYRATLRATYRNGATAEATGGPITLDVEAPTASVSLSSQQFSPNNDGTQDTLTISQQTSGGSRWTGEVRPAGSEESILEETWQDDAPESFTWNGQTEGGKDAATGEYRYVLTVRDAAGNTTRATTAPFLLDRAAPEVSFEVSGTPFTPDGNGENDTLEITIDASDNAGITSWSATAFGPTGDTFATFSGEGTPPAPITWDGRDADGIAVESAREYRIELTVTDESGNSSTTARTVRTGILVEEDQSGDLRFRITGIRFAPFTADYLNLENPENVQQNKQILDRVAEILKEYPDREVIIEGHAVQIYQDPERKEQEQQETLIPLSRARAEAIRQALVERDVSGDRLTVEAKGGSEPIVPHDNLEERWRNRRVEFELPAS
ncbi:MAG: OmpA family protein [Spirochaetes bacterium]|nr:OmpA family protein [Spirochaetota bacterium]